MFEFQRFTGAIYYKNGTIYHFNKYISGNPTSTLVESITAFGNRLTIQPLVIANFDSYMLDKLWTVFTDPSIIFISLLIFCLLSIQKKRKFQYLLNGKLANQHTINNMLINSMNIKDLEKQSQYLNSVAKFVNYGYSSQDKTTVPLIEELGQVMDFLKRSEITDERKIEFELQQETGTESFQIIPFALVTIVENAFNYGDLNILGNKLIIQISRLPEELYSISFSGYKLPGEQKLDKPLKGHGLHILKQRLKFIHFEKNTKSVANSKLITLSKDKNSLILIFPR